MLINESPLFVLPSLAVHVGLNEAIFLQQVHYWLQGSAGKEYEGRHWVYNTRDQWQRQFPFWSTDAIKRVVQSLRKQGVLLTNADLNKTRMDRTLWYTIDCDMLNQLANSLDASGDAAQSNQEELWGQLRLLGIPDRPALLMLLKRGPYESNIETLALARRRLEEKRHEASYKRRGRMPRIEALVKQSRYRRSSKGNVYPVGSKCRATGHFAITLSPIISRGRVAERLC